MEQQFATTEIHELLPPVNEITVRSNYCHFLSDG